MNQREKWKSQISVLVNVFSMNRIHPLNIGFPGLCLNDDMNTIDKLISVTLETLDHTEHVDAKLLQLRWNIRQAITAHRDIICLVTDSDIIKLEDTGKIYVFMSKPNRRLSCFTTTEIGYLFYTVLHTDSKQCSI